MASLAGVASGGYAVGGTAVGAIASGGVAVGYLAAGGVAAGFYTLGGVSLGVHDIAARLPSGTVWNQEGVALLETWMPWVAWMLPL